MRSCCCRCRGAPCKGKQRHKECSYVPSSPHATPRTCACETRVNHHGAVPALDLLPLPSPPPRGKQTVPRHSHAPYGSALDFGYTVPRTGVADTCQTHYGQTGVYPLSILSPGQGLRTRAKRTTGKQGLRYTPRPGHIVPRTGVESILSPGQGWHRRANAQKSYKSPPNGQPIN